jgi:hypothetical protein
MASDQGVSRPVHLQQNWRYFPVLRTTDEWNRKPYVEQPPVPKDGEVPSERGKIKAEYWAGYNWESVAEGVLAGETLADLKTGKPLAIDCAMLIEQSNVIVLDCDVREVWDSPDGEMFVCQPDGSARMAPKRTERGIEQLQTVIRGIGTGHEMSEIATFAVRTKSGGFHLIYRPNPDYPLRTRHHRENWCVDVLTVGWVAAPPSQGYEVVRDIEPQMIPGWLAKWIQNLSTNTKAAGGAKQRGLLAQGRAELQAVNDGTHVDWVSGDTSMVGHWVQVCLAAIARTNQVGGWNVTCWQVAKDFYAADFNRALANERIIKAADPRTARDRNTLNDTLDSAWRSWQNDQQNGRIL